MPEEKRIRVLLTKFELESHSRGVWLVAQILRDAGMEVIYTTFRTPAEITHTAMQEGVDVIGLSTFSGDTHKVFFPELMESLRENNMDRTLVIAGGRIPPEDVPQLLKLGVGKVFGPGSMREEIVDYINKGVRIQKGESDGKESEL